MPCLLTLIKAFTNQLLSYLCMHATFAYFDVLYIEHIDPGPISQLNKPLPALAKIKASASLIIHIWSEK